MSLKLNKSALIAPIEEERDRQRSHGVIGHHGDDPELEIGPYPSYRMGPMEILLIVLLFVVWFYAIRRIYIVWSNVLNFSALSTELAPRQKQGWDAFIQWALDQIRGLRPPHGQQPPQSHSSTAITPAAAGAPAPIAAAAAPSNAHEMREISVESGPVAVGRVCSSPSHSVIVTEIVDHDDITPSRGAMTTTTTTTTTVEHHKEPKYIEAPSHCDSGSSSVLVEMPTTSRAKTTVSSAASVHV